jgi:hypothetical protein
VIKEGKGLKEGRNEGNDGRHMIEGKKGRKEGRKEGR